MFDNGFMTFLLTVEGMDAIFIVINTSYMQEASDVHLSEDCGWSLEDDSILLSLE